MKRSTYDKLNEVVIVLHECARAWVDNHPADSLEELHAHTANVIRHEMDKYIGPLWNKAKGEHAALCLLMAAAAINRKIDKAYLRGLS